MARKQFAVIKSDGKRPRLRKIYLAVAGNGDDGGARHQNQAQQRGEEVLMIQSARGDLIPLVAIDADGLSVLRHYCQAMATETLQPVRIISFTSRNLHDTLVPSTTGDGKK